MTIIAAVRTETGVIMGADNLTHHGDLLMRRAVPKLWAVTPNIAVGCAGETRLIEVLRSAVWPQVAGLSTLEANMELHRHIVPAIKAEFPDKERDFNAIIAANGALFSLASDLSIVALEEPYWAIGHAKYAAMGALHATHRLAPTMPARERILVALAASADHVSGIRPPWVFAETTIAA